MLRNINSYTLGARSVNPKVTTTVIFTGDWAMPVKEAEAANSLIDQGVDVLTMHVDSPKVIVELAERRGVFVTGYHANQAALAPKGYLTGAEWNWGKVYTDYVNWIQAGKTYPHLLRGGLKDGFVKVSPYGKAVSAATKKKADAAKAKFMDGTMVVYKGPLKDNTGKVVIAAGVEQKQTDIALEKMDYLVEGVVGKTPLRARTMDVGVSIGASPVSRRRFRPPGRRRRRPRRSSRGERPSGARWRRSACRAWPSARRCCCSGSSWPSPAATRWPSTARCSAARSGPGSRSRTRCSGPRR